MRAFLANFKRDQIILIKQIVMDSISLTGISRTDTGKKATKAARREGKVPCVIYGGGEMTHFSITPKEVKPLVLFS